AIRADNAVLGDAYRDDALGKDVVIFAVPIYQTGGRFLGALTAKLDLAAVHHLLRRFAAGATGRVYLITAAGQPLVGSEAEHEAPPGSPGAISPSTCRWWAAASSGT